MADVIADLVRSATSVATSRSVGVQGIVNIMLAADDTDDRAAAAAGLAQLIQADANAGKMIWLQLNGGVQHLPDATPAEFENPMFPFTGTTSQCFAWEGITRFLEFLPTGQSLEIRESAVRGCCAWFDEVVSACRNGATAARLQEIKAAGAVAEEATRCIVSHSPNGLARGVLEAAASVLSAQGVAEENDIGGMKAWESRWWTERWCAHGAGAIASVAIQAFSPSGSRGRAEDEVAQMVQVWVCSLGYSGLQGQDGQILWPAALSEALRIWLETVPAFGRNGRDTHQTAKAGAGVVERHRWHALCACRQLLRGKSAVGAHAVRAVFQELKADSETGAGDSTDLDEWLALVIPLVEHYHLPTKALGIRALHQLIKVSGLGPASPQIRRTGRTIMEILKINMNFNDACVAQVLLPCISDALAVLCPAETLLPTVNEMTALTIDAIPYLKEEAQYTEYLWMVGRLFLMLRIRSAVYIRRQLALSVQLLELASPAVHAAYLGTLVALVEACPTRASRHAPAFLTVICDVYAVSVQLREHARVLRQPNAAPRLEVLDSLDQQVSAFVRQLLAADIGGVADGMFSVLKDKPEWSSLYQSVQQGK